MKIAPIVVAVLLLTPFVALAEMPISNQDRLLVLAPHPDDEALGAGGLIQRALASGAAVRVVFLTSGDRVAGKPPSEFRKFLSRVAFRFGIDTAARSPGLYQSRIRMDEARKAAALLGVSTSNLEFLSFPDRYTYDLWLEGWGSQPSIQSAYTGFSVVATPGSRRMGVPYRPIEILKQLKEILNEFRPTMIATSHPSDQHPDHRALYLYTRAALWGFQLEKSPIVLPYLVHYPGWPPEGDSADWPRTLGDVQVARLPLSGNLLAKKREALLVHQSQLQEPDPFLLKFLKQDEKFGDFAPIRLTEGKKQDLSDVVSDNRRPGMPSGRDPGSNDEKNLGPGEKIAGATDTGNASTSQISKSEVPIEWESVGWRNKSLEISLRCPQPLSEETTLVIAVQGDTVGQAFEEMPKLVVTCTESECSGADRGRTVGGVRSEWKERIRTISIDWATLGNPERAAVTAHTFYQGKLSAAPSTRIVERGVRRR